MRYRGENLVENSVNEGCRGWDLEDIAGDSLSSSFLQVPIELEVDSKDLFLQRRSINGAKILSKTL
jgi:hypothetical protein